LTRAVALLPLPFASGAVLDAIFNSAFEMGFLCVIKSPKTSIDVTIRQAKNCLAEVGNKSVQANPLTQQVEGKPALDACLAPSFRGLAFFRRTSFLVG
jgi:hypothetical protein